MGWASSANLKQRTFSAEVNKALSIFPCEWFVSVGASWKFAGLEREHRIPKEADDCKGEEQCRINP